MVTVETLILPLADCRDIARVGGKAAHLGALLRAGFRVPEGFVLTTGALSTIDRHDLLPASLIEQVLHLYRELDSPMVAVRSSATVEDLPDSSMAGQGVTTLCVQGEDALLAAIQACREGMDQPRVHAYLTERGVDTAEMRLAVIVQRMIPAEVSGILFTADPRTGSREEMRLEASWGLGEMVVSGRVQPDAFRIEASTGWVMAMTLGEKTEMLTGRGEVVAVTDNRRSMACLRPAEVNALWEIGKRAEAHFGRPVDLEWAVLNGEVYVLQCRAITNIDALQQRATLLAGERERLRVELAAGHGPWVAHNLGETVPHPTPLTWSLLSRFMSGSGGYGALYREIGFQPSAAACRDGFLTRIAGQIYMDLARTPDLFAAHFPFRYDLDAIRDNPNTAQGAPTVPHGALGARIAASRMVAASHRRLRALAGDYDQRFQHEIVPKFLAWCREEQAIALSSLSAGELWERWHVRERVVLDEFAPRSLLPGMILGMAQDALRQFLAEHFWDDEPETLLYALAVPQAPDQTLANQIALHAVAEGEQSIEEWIAAFGHRASEEFELASPRWHERLDAVERMLAPLRESISPCVRFEERQAQAEARLAELSTRLSPRDRQELLRLATLVRQYLPFREDGKHILMQGYALLRDVALEAGRRLETGDDVFMLTADELHDALATGFPPLHVLAQRRKAYDVEHGVRLPAFIDTATVDTLGVPASRADSNNERITALSPGVATGLARIVHDPTAIIEAGSILVCASTDPAWTPLVARAAGLIVERGGALSHGAIVARELGVPAIALPEATALLHDGETITVDGDQGTFSRLDAQALSPSPNADDIRIPARQLPPPPGRGERRAARLRNFGLLLWGLYLLGVIILPRDWLYQPSLRALDMVCWPLVPALGRPGAVAVIAVALALIMAILQWLLIDNRRLREVKRRAAQLRREADTFPAGSRRKTALLRVAGMVQGRVMAASLVPIAVLLGPLVLLCAWFPARVDPASRAPEPGTTVNIVATLDSAMRQPCTLLVSPPLSLGAMSPPTQTLPPIRETLEQLATSLRIPQAQPYPTWEMQAAAIRAREDMLADLEAYLQRGVPPGQLTWQVQSAPQQPGRFPITITASDVTFTTHLTLGDAMPPSALTITPPGDSPLRSMQVVVPPDSKPRVFWTPLARFGRPGWDAGWLFTYLLAYLPAMLLFRAVLKLP